MSDDGDSTLIGDRKALDALLKGDQRDHAYVVVIAGPNVGEMHKIHGTLTVGRGETADVRLLDNEMSREHVRLSVAPDTVRFEDLSSTNGTFVNGSPAKEGTLHDGDRIQVGTTTILKLSFHDDVEEEFQKRMYESAVRDGLTGAYNKKFFVDRLEAEIAFSLRHGVPLSLVLFDLDHFKAVNDTYGHLAGDAVLRDVGERVEAATRREDLLARYGGEEFAVILRGVEGEDAKVFGERIRSAIESHSIEFENEILTVTASVGIATLRTGAVETSEALISAADAALYESKHAGRNRVSLHETVEQATAD